MPASPIRTFLGQGDAGRLHEIDCHQAGNVRDRKFITGRELTILQLLVEQAQELDGLVLVCLAPFGDLRHFPLPHRRVDVAESVRYRPKQVKLQPPLPHFDCCLAERISTEQGRFGIKLFEIPADGNRLGQHRAVIQFQNRKALERVAARYLLTLMFHRPHVHRHQRYFYAFLCQEDPHPPRIWSAAAVKKLHVLFQMHGLAAQPYQELSAYQTCPSKGRRDCQELSAASPSGRYGGFANLAAVQSRPPRPLLWPPGPLPPPARNHRRRRPSRLRPTQNSERYRPPCIEPAAAHSDPSATPCR